MSLGLCFSLALKCMPQVLFHGNSLVASTAASISCASTLHQRTCWTGLTGGSATRSIFSVSAPRQPPLIAGQATHETHPELVGPGELTRCVTAAEYAGRRRQLAQQLPPGGAAIVAGAASQFMSNVIPYPYRPDSDLFYLTGLMQPAVALVQVPHGSSKPVLTLFIDPPNPTRARWDGETVSREAARQLFGADEVYYTQEMPRRLLDLASSGAELLYDADRHTACHHHAILTALRPAAEAKRVGALRPLLHGLRLVKSPAEARLLRASAALSAASMRRCIAATRPGVSEYELAALFEYGVRAGGAQRLAYPSIVAGGPDACTIHYSANNKALREGQLLLMDAGCEYWGYVSDVTRTWPVAGRYTGPQADVYSVVLEAHRRCVDACKPGVCVRELHHLCIDILSQGIQDLKLRPGESLATIRQGVYRDFFCHSLGHYLGLDTHDTHLIGHDRRLERGMAITIEPGLYIPDEERYGPFRGIGVRIEDDVLLTAHGCEVLSIEVPSAMHEVEELMGQAMEARRGGAAAAPACRSASGEATPEPLPSVAAAAVAGVAR